MKHEQMRRISKENSCGVCVHVILSYTCGNSLSPVLSLCEFVCVCAYGFVLSKIYMAFCLLFCRR